MRDVLKGIVVVVSKTHWYKLLCVSELIATVALLLVAFATAMPIDGVYPAWASIAAVYAGISLFVFAFFINIIVGEFVCGGLITGLLAPICGIIAQAWDYLKREGRGENDEWPDPTPEVW